MKKKDIDPFKLTKMLEMIENARITRKKCKKMLKKNARKMLENAKNVQKVHLRIVFYQERVKTSDFLLIFWQANHGFKKEKNRLNISHE